MAGRYCEQGVCMRLATFRSNKFNHSTMHSDACCNECREPFMKDRGLTEADMTPIYGGEEPVAHAAAAGVAR